MPLYEYVCLDCRTHFDVLRPMKDADAPITCQECHSDHTARQLSLFFAHSDGRAVATQSGAGCGGCSGGTCATCGR